VEDSSPSATKNFFSALDFAVQFGSIVGLIGSSGFAKSLALAPAGMYPAFAVKAPLSTTSVFIYQ
jgi:ABC-type protease/lipase transport system fused ATPase/permease subunit